MADKFMKMERQTKWEALQLTGDGPDILRLEIMGREIITKILAMRPIEQASPPPPAEPPKQTLADD